MDVLGHLCDVPAASADRCVSPGSRRKVEATMMGLEGTDFSPEDVIGDDLRKMDAQIASFQRRIDGTVSDLLAGLGAEWWPAARRCGVAPQVLGEGVL